MTLLELRRSVERDYDSDSGRITSPGKFEGEPLYVPALWQLAMEGFQDDTMEIGTILYEIFSIDSEVESAFADYSLKRAGDYILLWSDDNGFVNSSIVTEEELDSFLDAEEEGDLQFIHSKVQEYKDRLLDLEIDFVSR
jgi:hypothetical protein